MGFTSYSLVIGVGFRRTAMDVSVTPESTRRNKAQLALEAIPYSPGYWNLVDSGLAIDWFALEWRRGGEGAIALNWIGMALESCAGVFDWSGWALHNFTHNKNLKKIALNQSLIDLNQRGSTEFSKFIRTATHNEKEAVFERVMRQVAKEQRNLLNDP